MIENDLVLCQVCIGEFIFYNLTIAFYYAVIASTLVTLIWPYLSTICIIFELSTNS